MIFDYNDDVLTLMNDEETHKVVIQDDETILALHDYIEEMVEQGHLGDTEIENYQNPIRDVSVFFVNGNLIITDSKQEENNYVVIDNEDDYQNFPNCLMMVARDIRGEPAPSMFDLFGDPEPIENTEEA